MAGTTSSGASNATYSLNPLKRKSNDIGWNYATIADENDKDKVKCSFCLNVYSGGINRLKKHVAHESGDIVGCLKAPDDARAACRVALAKNKDKKKKKNDHCEEVRREVSLSSIAEINRVEVMQGGKRGPMDNFTSTSTPNSSDGNHGTTTTLRQQNIKDALHKNASLEVHQFMARWMYEAAIPFHAISYDSFQMFVEAVGQFSPGYHPPSQYLLREPLLKGEVERTKSQLKKHEKEWTLTGCSIMTDAWSDRKKRSIMNICVNCKEGTTFLSSKEASEDSHTGLYIFEYVDKYIEHIGPQNVIQVVTDNASNNMSAARMMEDKRPHLFWTSCATHTINLMLQGIGELPKFKVVIEKAKHFTNFIYAHTITLALMRKFTNKKEIVRPGVTRFASAFLTLESLLEKKAELKALVASEQWEQCKPSKSAKGKVAYTNILNPGFWHGVSLCVNVFTPLIKVLRLVDGEKKPSMGFLYGELKQARNQIKEVFNNVDTNYAPILDIIDTKGRERLDSPLHLAGYYLNPYYFYKDQSIYQDVIVNGGFLDCVDAFFPDQFDAAHQVTNVEVKAYRNKEGMFGRPLAMAGCSKNDDTYDPVGWWFTYGSGVPNLQRMAIRILSLTTSSSGCERNWSTFEGVHTKKRNRLEAARVSNLVYVKFNAKIINKRKRELEMGLDPLVASIDDEALEWYGKVREQGDGGSSPRLGEEDFLSDEENIEDESDIELIFDECEVENFEA